MNHRELAILRLLLTFQWQMRRSIMMSYSIPGCWPTWLVIKLKFVHLIQSFSRYFPILIYIYSNVILSRIPQYLFKYTVWSYTCPNFFPKCSLKILCRHLQLKIPTYKRISKRWNTPIAQKLLTFYCLPFHIMHKC